jgi:hypothetical protein
MFEDQVKMLAFRSGLKIIEVNSSRAKLGFEFDKNGKETVQNCYITSFKDGKYWEFDCLSGLTENMLPEILCKFLLKENSKHFRGFWCLEKIGEDNVLVYMHNIASELLTPDEFSDICWDVTRRVDELERELLS